jgi:hypothetical protein
LLHRKGVRQEASEDGTAQQEVVETYKYTGKIKFLGVGTSENGDRFLKRRVGKDVALISVAKLLSEPIEELVRLQRVGAILAESADRVGVILAESADRRELLGRVRTEASKEPTFRVATQPGLLGDDFFFPDGSVSGARRTRSTPRSSTPTFTANSIAPAAARAGGSCLSWPKATPGSSPATR